MFQDEARFGRMAKPRRCWAPKPCRPIMLNGYEREFVYAYGAVSPPKGDVDWKTCRQMKTKRMTDFLGQTKVSLSCATNPPSAPDDGANKSLPLPATNSPRFYRLRHP